MAERKIPQDHPAKKEARGENHSVEYDGTTYSIPPSGKWDIDVVEAAEDGRIVACVKALLGPDQWAKFRKDHSTIDELEKFFDKLGEVVGGNL